MINTKERFAILGVSFGGLVAVEIRKKLKPALTILISSAETKNELRSIYRLIGKSKIIKLLPRQLFDPPRKIAHWLFGTSHTKLLSQILDDTDLQFAKWAVNALLNWQNTTQLAHPTLKISGTKDKLIPPQKDSKQIRIDQGAHFMIVDRAAEISKIINEEIRKIDQQSILS